MSENEHPDEREEWSAAVDAEVIPAATMTVEEQAQAQAENEALVPYAPPPPATLFGTADPKVALERMAEIATALYDVIEAKHLFAVIKGKRHVTVEGWTTLGGMLGIVPVVTSTRRNEDGDGIIAHVEARRVLDGAVVGAAEGECSRAEDRWKDVPPYAIRSMAQTRGISRALSMPLRQIVVLAGYEPTTAEEMISSEESAESGSAVVTSTGGPIPDEVKPTPEQLAEITGYIEKLSELRPDEDWVTDARTFLGIRDATYMTRTMADQLIAHQKLTWELAASVNEAVQARAAEEALAGTPVDSTSGGG